MSADDRHGPVVVDPPSRVYVIAPPGTRSRFYENDQADPGAPRLLAEYFGAYHQGALRPGDQVTYFCPVAPYRGSPAPEGVPLVIAELIDFGAGPVQAVLNDGDYECSADNLRKDRHAER